MVAQVAPQVAGPRQQAWFRALDHARLLGVKPTYTPSRDAYRVTSPRAGDTYHIHPVEVDGVLTYECDCMAGEHGRVCWHAALVAALPGECSRRRTHNARCRAERAAEYREVVETLIAQTPFTLTASVELTAGKSSPLDELFA